MYSTSIAIPAYLDVAVVVATNFSGRSADEAAFRTWIDTVGAIEDAYDHPAVKMSSGKLFKCSRL